MALPTKINSGQRGKKRTEPEKELIKNVISEHYLKGYSVYEIQNFFLEKYKSNISRITLYKYLKELKEEWVKKRSLNFDLRISEELEKLDALERVYWEAWENSKRLLKKKIEKKYYVPEAKDDKDKDKGKGKSKDVTSKKEDINHFEERDGNPHFLQGIERCISKRLEVLGISQVNVQVVNNETTQNTLASEVIINVLNTPPEKDNQCI